MAEAESVLFDEARKFLSMRAQAADEFKIGLLGNSPRPVA